MRGFAIPRRWLISLALVGLVSLFSATLTSSWLDPSSAAADHGTGTGPTHTPTPTNTPTPTTPPTNLTLGSVIVAPNGVTIAPNGSIQLEVRLRNTANTVNNSLPVDSITFLHFDGPGTSLVQGTDPRFATFTAAGSGTAKVRVTVVQGSISREAELSIFVVAPAPTATSAPPPTNPGPVPASIPNASSVITPAEGGSSSDPSDPKNTISIPAGATTSFLGVNIETQSADVPPGPGSFKIGSRVVNISFVDESGNLLTGVRLARAAQICIPVTQDDIFAAAGGVAGLKILRYADPPGEWVELNTTYNPLTGQICAHSSNFSLFAVGLSTDFPAVDGTGLPATGDTPLSAGLLAFLGVTGVALVGVGTVAFRRSRKAGSIS